MPCCRRGKMSTRRPQPRHLVYNEYDDDDYDDDGDDDDEDYDDDDDDDDDDDGDVNADENALPSTHVI